MDVDAARRAMVWGNCQAGPVAELLAGPLAAHDIEVIRVPPVYQLTAEDLAAVHRLMPSIDVLFSQPISDTYLLGGCGTGQLVELMRADARVITFPVAHLVAAFPYQIRGYDGRGRRVDAPVTDYHDLRVLLAARARLTAEQASTGGARASTDALRAVGEAARSELRRREQATGVRITDVLSDRGALWTMTHPSNSALAVLSARLLQELGLTTDIRVPDREFLGQRRAPVEVDVIEVLGWSADTAEDRWVVDGETVDPVSLLHEQLTFYRRCPDVVAESLHRAARRLAQLGWELPHGTG